VGGAVRSIYLLIGLQAEPTSFHAIKGGWWVEGRYEVNLRFWETAPPPTL